MNTLTNAEILQLAEICPESKELLQAKFPDTFKSDLLDLRYLRAQGSNALAISDENYIGGKRLILSLNSSPLQPFTNQSLLIAPDLTAELVEGQNGNQLLVFKKKK